MRDRLKMAYATAMKATHEGSRVEIHLGSDVVEYLRSLCPIPGAVVIRPTFWGFPVVDSTVSPDHISIHTITTII